MIYTTICLYAKQATSQMDRAATDLVEFYTDVSPPCQKSEFEKTAGLFNNVHAVNSPPATRKKIATLMLGTWTAEERKSAGE